jgi:hypothetical protein
MIYQRGRSSAGTRLIGFANSGLPLHMVFSHLLLKTQCLQTLRAKAVDILRFHIRSLFIVERNMAALAFCNIAHLAFENA